jgi:hypothetical protein
MPHLPEIEVIGGSVSVSFPATEGVNPRVSQCAFNGDTDIVHATSEHPEIRKNRYADSDHESMIYLIEIRGTPGSPIHRFTPNAAGICSIKIHYLSGAEVRAGERDNLRLPDGTIELEDAAVNAGV